MTENRACHGISSFISFHPVNFLSMTKKVLELNSQIQYTMFRKFYGEFSGSWFILDTNGLKFW